MIENRRKWWILTVAAAGVLLSTVDASIVNIALPTISEYFKASVQTTAWVTISYLLVITTVLLIFGRLSDIYGQKLVFGGGLLIFTIGSALCAFSANITKLVVFRLIQGIGAAMIVSNTSAIVTNAFPGEQRGMALGTIGAVVSIGLMSGPPLGGLIIHYLGWHYIFLVNVPIGVMALILTARVLPELKADSSTRLFHPLDSLLWIVGITLLVLAFRGVGNMASVLLSFTACFSICIIVLAVFFKRQSTADSPLLKISFLKNDIFLFASIAGFFSYMAMIALTFMLPFLLENSYGKTPFDTGKILVVIPATTVFISPISGFLSDKLGQRPVASVGSLISTLAIASMFFAAPEYSSWGIIASLIVFGVGLGMFGSPNNSALMGSVDYKDRGAAGGILATVRNLGMVSGLGIISVIYNSGITRVSASPADAYFLAFKKALPIVAGFSFMALVFSALRKSVREAASEPDAKVARIE